MMPSYFWRQLAREARSSGPRLAFFVLSLAVGVGAVVAVAGLSAALDGALRREARQLLAADLTIEGRRPLGPEVDAALTALDGAVRADVTELVTMVAAPPGFEGRPGPSLLVELKAISGPYPLYGSVALAPDRPLAELLADGGAVAAPELLARLGLALGDEVVVGGRSLRLRGTVTSEPDRIAGAFSLGPRLFVDRAALAGSSLLGRGARAEHRALVRLPEGAGLDGVRRAAAALERNLANPHLRVETYLEAQPALRQGLARAERFLGLVALLSLLVGGVGVAQTVRAWLASRLDAIAILGCLGWRPREVLALFLGQTAILAGLGSLVGGLLGLGLQAAAVAWAPDFLPPGSLRLWQPAALLQGTGLGLGVALLFSLPPLVALLRVPAARVLRRDAEPAPASRGLAAGLAVALAAGVTAVAAAQSHSLRDGALFAGGLGVAVALFWAAAVGVARLARRAPRRRLGITWRHGIAALGRPGAATLGAIVSLGLGVLVVLGISLVEGQLSRRLLAELPTGAPTVFLVDVQPGQRDGLGRRLHDLGATRTEIVPVVVGRLSAIDGRPTAELAATGPERGARRWALTREQRLTWLDRLPVDNEIVAGALWSDPAAAEVSVEEEFARDLGLVLGSRLTFDVQGVPVGLVVTSLRRVRWESFAINFFLVAEPGTLDAAPHQLLAAARLPAAAEQRAQDALAADFPNITLLRVRELLERVSAILSRVARGVRLLGGLTALAGTAILAGAVGATAARRGREVALLKALGMRRSQVIAALALEHALTGLVAALIGSAAAGLLAWAVLTRGMEIGWTFSPLPFLLALFLTPLVALLAGLAASLGPLARRPIEALRHD